MKKLVLYVVSVFFAASALAPAFALANNATSTPIYPRGAGRGVSGNVRLKAQELRGSTATSTPMMRGEETRKAREEKRKQERDVRLQQLIQKMTKRFNAAIAREEKFADRIASRLDKAAHNGKNVAALRAKLTDARLKIADAKTALGAAVAKLQTAAASSQMKEETDPFADVTAKLKAAHAALVDVINSLKGIGNTATTTPQSR